MSNVTRVIDIGNTAVKIALFNPNESAPRVEKFQLNQLGNAKKFIEVTGQLPTIVSNVNEKSILEAILPAHHQFLLFTQQTLVPIENLYTTPATLGLDRLANAVGASAIFPNQNVLCIDFGTCIKYDIISAQNCYLGGSIAPGLTMRFKALHTFTVNLPLVKEYVESDLIGTSTQTAIISGCLNGARHEVMHTIYEYNQRFDRLQVILTGGEMEHFTKLVVSEKNSIFADPLLTLKGLNTILLANV
jgi:type III pantothenate kinase